MSAIDQRRRRVMSSSSSFGCSSSEMCTGSSAIPQIGHEPGPICRISGCIGQVYSASGSAGAECLAAGHTGADELFGTGFEAVEAALVAEVVRVATVLDLADRIGRRDRHATDGIENVLFYLLRHLLEVLLRVGVELVLTDLRTEIISLAVVHARRRGPGRIHVHSTHYIAFHHGLQSTITTAPLLQRKCGISDALDEVRGSRAECVSDGVAHGWRRLSSLLLVDGERPRSSPGAHNR